MSIPHESRRSRTRSHVAVLGTGALAFLLGAPPAGAQQTDEDVNARVERIASTYRLTEPVLKKVAALTREFVALARTDPSIVKADDDSGTSVSAAVRAIFTRVGIREEEYENFSIASAFAALGTWAAGQSREVAEAAKEMPPITRANMAFLKTHAAALKAIEQDVMLLKEMAEAPSKDPPGSR